MSPKKIPLLFQSRKIATNYGFKKQIGKQPAMELRDLFISGNNHGKAEV